VLNQDCLEGDPNSLKERTMSHSPILHSAQQNSYSRDCERYGRKLINAFAVLLVLLLCVWPLTSFAQTVPVIDATTVLEPAAAVLAYWTPERLRNAMPRDILVNDQETRPDVNFSTTPDEPDEPEVSLPDQLPAGSQPEILNPADSTLGSTSDQLADGYSYPYPFTRFEVLPFLYESEGSLIYPYITIGKLFVTRHGEDFTCSAAVVRPHLVLTVRSCVFDYVHPRGGQYATNVVFFPGWRDGPNPNLKGGWPARNIVTWTENTPGGPSGVGVYDIAFIQTFDDVGTGCGGSDGRPIEDFTGFLGIRWGGSYASRHWNQFGYSRGERLVEVQSSTGAENTSLPDTVEVGNDMGRGAGGGPWILGFDPVGGGNPGGNYANGLNSFVRLDRPLAADSPKFRDYNFNQLRLIAAALPCP
jgi:hypothetical protein